MKAYDIIQLVIYLIVILQLLNDASERLYQFFVSLDNIWKNRALGIQQ